MSRTPGEKQTTNTASINGLSRYYYFGRHPPCLTPYFVVILALLLSPHVHINIQLEQVEADMLRVIAELRMLLRQEDIPLKIVVFMVGYAHPQSTGFLRAKSKLKKKNMIATSKGHIRLTHEGVLAAPQDVTPPTDNSEVQERLRTILHTKVKPVDKFDIIYNALCDGKSHTREELLDAAGYKHPQSTGFLKTMAALRELNLLEKAGSGAFQLADIAFPCGR